MEKKKINLTKLILPNKSINYFTITVILLGIISGSIFLMISSTEDKTKVIEQITLFFTNIKDNSLNDGLALRNSLIINYLFLGLIWIFGLSMIGIIFNIFIAYLKGFLVGFSLASIFLTYNIKGIPSVILYTFFSQILNIFVIFLVTVYSIMFSKYLTSIIIQHKKIKSNMFKKYLIILMFCIIISFISSILEVYVLPKSLSLFISLYVK